MAKQIAAREMVTALDMPCEILGNPDRAVARALPVDQAGSDSVSFCSKQGEVALDTLHRSRAGILVFPDNIPLDPDDYRDRTIIRVTRPRLAFIQLLKSFFTAPVEFTVHPTAVIEPGADIAENVAIGPYSHISACRIGEGSVIHSHVRIFSGSKIGRRVTVFPGVVIGSEGFGFERDESGKPQRFPQIGGVTIGDDVEIGANCTVDRGALVDTVIGEGTKIDNLCHIAHSVVIGRDCMITAMSMIAGSTRIGDNCYIAPSASIMNKLNIGANVLVGQGAVVTRDVPDNTVVVGVPARPIRENR